MEIIVEYVCPICRNRYTNNEDAINCVNSNETPKFKVGDIVEVKYGFGWYDGSKNWVINPDVDMRKHGFDKDSSMGFYYVITAIEMDGHRVRYYVATNAMTEENGHKGGYTYIKNHYTPKLIEAPEIVKLESNSLIGKKIDWLLL